MPEHPCRTRMVPQDPQSQSLGFLRAAPQNGWRVREKQGPTQVMGLAHRHPARQHCWPTDLKWDLDIFKESTQNTRPLSVGHSAGATHSRLRVEQSVVSQICTVSCASVCNSSLVRNSLKRRMIPQPSCQSQPLASC